MREQPTTVKTGQKKKLLWISAAVLLCAAAILLAWKLPKQTFTPPEFDSTAISGQPEPEDNFGYGEISVENGFSFFVAANIYQQEDGSVMLYLTNPADSGCELVGEIVDSSGKVLYKSGAIRPGCYVERLSPKRKFKNEAMQVEMRVYAYEPDTWYSFGTISLDNTLQAW